MPSLVKTLGLVLVLATGSLLGAQTARPADPYGGPAHQVWTDQTRYQQPAIRQPVPAPVIRAGYEAEVPQQDARQPRSDSLSLPEPGAALALPSQGSQANSRGPDQAGALPSVVTVVGSLALVLGLFLVLAWAMRRATPAESGVLPGEVVEVLGRKAIAGRQQLQLLRCGHKLLLVSITPEGAETLTEITDPDEVDRLAGLCRQTQPGSATATFRQMFHQFSTDRTEGRHG